MRAERGDERSVVLYIAGSGRSGSTVLGRILGRVEGFGAVGELRYVWERRILSMFSRTSVRRPTLTKETPRLFSE